MINNLKMKKTHQLYRNPGVIPPLRCLIEFGHFRPNVFLPIGPVRQFRMKMINNGHT